MSRWLPAIGLAAFAAGSVRADVLYDTLWITDQHRFDSGYANTLGGRGVFGELYDLRVADDFEVRADAYPTGFVVQSVTADYLAFLGRSPSDGVYVRVHEDEGGRPREPALYDELATGVTMSEFQDYTSLRGVRFRIDDLSIALEAGHYWVSIQPADFTAAGDWWYQLSDSRTRIGLDPHGTDGDLGLGLYGWGVLNWESLGEHGYGFGATAMKIEGVPGPATMAILVLAALHPLRRGPNPRSWRTNP